MKDFEILTKDRLHLKGKYWQPAEPKAALCIVHGLGDHMMRHAHVASYLCDNHIAVFLYDQRGHGTSDGKRGHMPSYNALLDDVEAVLKKAKEEHLEVPLFLYGHSMGGNIVYDLLPRELADVRIDLLVTAGTQVGFFEELKLFRDSDLGIPNATTPTVPRPENVARWINIFDHSDLLGYEVGSVIQGVEDFSYQTGSLLKAHSQYFIQPGFHERLAARAAPGSP